MDNANAKGLTLEEYLRIPIRSNALITVESLVAIAVLCWFYLMPGIMPLMVVCMLLLAIFVGYAAWLRSPLKIVGGSSGKVVADVRDAIAEDFTRSLPLLGGYVRLGEVWLYGQGAKRPVDASCIDRLRVKPGMAGFTTGVVIVSCGAESVRFRYRVDESPDKDFAALASYVQRKAPGAVVDPALLVHEG